MTSAHWPRTVPILLGISAQRLQFHFSWALWQIGEAPEAEWLAQLEFTRKAFRDQRLGFADHYLFKTIDPLAAQQQRDGDTAEFRPASAAAQIVGAVV